MIRTILLICILFVPTLIAEPYLYVNTTPTAGFGIKSNKSQYYLGINWNGYFDKHWEWGSNGNVTLFDSWNGLVLSPVLGYRYNFNNNNINPYLNSAVQAVFDFAQDHKGIPFSILIGFGMAFKLSENIEITGEYNLSYTYDSRYWDNGNIYFSKSYFTQAPYLSFVYYFTNNNNNK
jgi:hypothetical protein